MSHTPGPWRAVNKGAYNDFNGQSQVVLGDDDTRRIAAVHVSDEETAANAKLIAAAPELLEACRRVANTDPETMTDPQQFILWAQKMCGAAFLKAVTVLALLACVQAHAAEFGLTWSQRAEPVRTNYNGQVISGRIAEPTEAFWQAWRTNKTELKADGYTCRPIGKHWQVIKLEGKR